MIRLPSSFVLVAASVAALLSFAPSRSAAANAPRVFRAGAATSNVTPPLGTSINGGFQDVKALHIHDELHARCLALDDGTTKLVLVVVDNCVIGRDVFDAAKQQVQAATGLPRENMLMSATHAHSCGTLQPVGQSEPDPAYRTFVAQRIADGVRRALNNLAPAKIGWGYGEVPQHVFNRRWHLKPGTMPLNPFGNTSDQVKMNPGVGNPNLVRPAGPTDPQAWFISVQNAAGRPLALYANYSLHYVGGVGPGHISADYFGAFADRIQELLGADRQDPPFVGLMSNGTSGDINNINFQGDPARKPPYAQIRLVANDVAQEVVRVARTLKHHDWVPLGVAHREVTLGLRIPDRETVEKARGVMKGSKAYPRMLTSEEVYAREAVLLADFPAQVSAPLQVLKIGDLRVSAIPAEVFVEIGLELKRRHPQTFTVSLANAYHGYLPTPEQHRLGGYETWRARSACLEVDASAAIAAFIFLTLNTADPAMMTNNHRWDADTYAILGIVAIWRGRPYLGGILLAFSVWATPILALTAVAAVAASLLIKQSPWRVIAGGATGAALGVFALLATGSLGAFIDNLLWAKNNYSEANRMAYGEVIGGYPALFEGASSAGDWIVRVMVVIGLTLPVWLPPLCGLLVLKNRDRNLIYFCVCGLSMIAGVSPRFDVGHLVFAVPLFYPVAASFLNKARWVVIPVGAIAGVFLLSALVQRADTEQIDTPVGRVRTDKGSAELVRWLTANIKQGEPMFVYPYPPVAYFLTRGQNVSRFCVLQPGLFTLDDEKQATDDMLRRPPAKILYMDVAPKEFLRIWPASDPNRLQLRHIHEFVTANYQDTAQFRNLHIYTPTARTIATSQPTESRSRQ